MKEVKSPVLRDKSAKSWSKDSETFDHDAFGLVSISHVQGDTSSLFGSDLKHSHFISLKIKRASVTRDLSNDWYSSEGELIEVLLSANQYAELITTPNRGEGVPCTINHAPVRGTPSTGMPDIKKLESKADLFRKEIQDTTAQQMEKVKEALKKIEDMLAGDKMSKKDLKAAVFNMKCHIDNTPSNMAFVVQQAEEALDKVVVSAKADVEAFCMQTALKLGYASIKEAAKLGLPFLDESNNSSGNIIEQDVEGDK